ncbi:MAG TPA: hypothetical protein VFW97_07190, partial [Acidimicrobiia bacterium]|nr:hypothetical protein [Acidimicrobiia bacterium]
DRRPTTRCARWCPPMIALVVTIPLAAFPVVLPVPMVAMVVAAAAGAAAARLWGISGRVGAVVFVAVMVASLVVAACSGAAPWPSRALSRVRARPVRLVVDALAAATIAGGVAATLASGSIARDLGVVTASLLETTVVIAAFAIHLWRFDPRRRARELALLLTIGVVGVVVAPELAPLVAAIGALAAARCARVAPMASSSS